MFTSKTLRPLLFLTLFVLAAARPGLAAAPADLESPAAAPAPLGLVVRSIGGAETPRGPLSSGDPIFLGDQIAVAGSGAWIEIKLDRGGELWLGANARLTLGEMEQVSTCDRPRDVLATLVLANGHLRIAHDERDPAMGPARVEVRTPNATLCLLGSTVDVKARRRNAAHDASTFVFVSAGGVEISCPAGARRPWPTVRLSAGTLLAFDDRGPAQPIRLSLDVPLSFFALAQATLGILEDSPLEDRIDPRGVFSR